MDEYSQFFFFFLSVKRCILKKKKTVLCKKTQHIKDYNKKEKRKLITKKERAKEHGKRVIRCKPPSLGPIIEGTSKTSKQIVIRFIYIV